MSQDFLAWSEAFRNIICAAAAMIVGFVWVPITIVKLADYLNERNSLLAARNIKEANHDLG